MKTTTYHSKRKAKLKKIKSKKTEISDDLRKRVIAYWKSNTNNTVPDLMREFNITEAVGHSIIDTYLQQKIKIN